MKVIFFVIALLFCKNHLHAQLKWSISDSIQPTLLNNLTLYFTIDSLDGKPNKAYYIKANLKNKNLVFDVDTTLKRRLTPFAFFEKNKQPIVVVNGTFFSYKTNQNLNTVIKNGRAISFNTPNTKGISTDSTKTVKMYRSAIGISKNRNADVAWVNSDSSKKASASQTPITPITANNIITAKIIFKKWRVKTAIGGGPVLIQNRGIAISNNEELLFAGNAKFDKHPRTAMGYTADGYLIILVVEGRNAGVAEGANLLQLANMLKDIGCVEALNLDGGGSSCMLVNGKETIKPSDKTGQRAVPAVFMIKTK